MMVDRTSRARSFAHTGDDYHRLRPRYPDEVVDWMLPPGARRVLDLGAGTGILSDALVTRGLEVVAVEPSRQMLDVLRRRHPEVACHEGSAEAIPLAGESIDAVVVGQAWHWMDPVAAGAEIARVLRPGGWLAMAWNADVADEPWLVEFEAVQSVPRGKQLNADDRDPHPGEQFLPFEDMSVTWRREMMGLEFLELHKTHSAWLVADEETRSDRERQWLAILERENKKGLVQLSYRTDALRTSLLV